MAVRLRFWVIFITDNYTIDRRHGRTSEITAFMVFTNESDTVFNSIIELFAIKKEQGILLPNNNLECYISEGSYIIDLHLIDG
ncbi:hypothetical protein VN1248_06830 [Helicobacter pylori]|nr:hypothetical protein VN1248_06830 [Helicobacter pylori]